MPRRDNSNSLFSGLFFEKSAESDFSDFQLHKKINGFSGFQAQKLAKLKDDLALKMPVDELIELRKAFRKNPPTVMALKILDDYRSSARACFTEELSEIRLSGGNPHIMKALKKYEELKKRFSPDTPRNISEIGLMTRNVAGREKESVFFGGGRTQAECETFDKGKRVGYYSSIITKWDEADLRAERRAAVEAVLYGFEPQAFFTDAADTTRMDEFNEYAESLAMAAYGYCRGTEKTVKATALGISEIPRIGSGMPDMGDKIILLQLKDVERAALTSLRQFLKEAGISVKRAINNDVGFLNGLFALNYGFDADVSETEIFGETGEELFLEKRVDLVTLVVRRGRVKQVLALTSKYGFAAAVVGRFTSRASFRLMNKGAELTSIDMAAIYYADYDFRNYNLGSVSEPYKIISAEADLKSMLKNVGDVGDMNACQGGKTVVGTLLGVSQNTASEAGVVKPGFSGFGNAVNAVSLAEPQTGGDIFTRAVNTALNAVMKLVATGISIYNIQLNPAFLLPEGSFERGKLLEYALGVFYLENALSLNSLGYGTARSKDISSPQLRMQATGYSGDGALIDGIFKSGYKIYKIGIPRDEFGIPDFKFILKLAAQININASTENLLAARLISGSVAEAVVAGTAGDRLGFSFSGKLSAQGENLSDLLLALDDAEEFAAFDPEYIGVVDDSGRIKSALFNVTHSELNRASARYPFELNPGQRTAAAPVTQKAVALRSHSVAMPKLMIIHDDFASEGAFIRAATEHGFAVSSLRISRDYVINAENLRSVRESILSSDMLVICGRNAYGTYSNCGKMAQLIKAPVVTDAINELLYRNEGLILSTGLGSKILGEMGLLSRGSAEYSGVSGISFSGKKRIDRSPKLPGIRISNHYSPMLSAVKLRGRYFVAPGGAEMGLRVEKNTLLELQTSGQIAAQFIDPTGMPTLAFPYNPFESDMAIAALSSPDGRVLGFFCLPEKTAFLRGGNDLIDIVFRSSYQYFSARG